MNTVQVVKNEHPPIVHVTNDRGSISSKSSKMANLDEVSKPLSTLTTTPPVKDVLGSWIWGNETDLDEENTLLFNNPVAFGRENIVERRKFFQTKANRIETTYKTDRIYNLEVSSIILLID